MNIWFKRYGCFKLAKEEEMVGFIVWEKKK